MAISKNAQIRYRIIDRCICNKYKPFPTKEDLRKSCEEALFGSDDGTNIHDSTIEKDIFAMRMEHDAPIKYSKKHHGYFYEDENFSLSELPLTEDDLEAIKFAANTLIQFKDVEMFKQFGFAIDKIFDRVNISNNPQEKDIADLVQFETATSVTGNEHLSPLLTAIRQKQIIQFEYESFLSGKKKARRVVPLMLKEYRNRWYTITYDCVKESLVTYALERIENLEETPEFFNQQIDFNPKKFFKNAIGITASDASPEKVILKAENISSKYIISQPFHDSQKVVKEGKNRTTFQLDVTISEELIRSLLSYGGEVEVAEPQNLRETIIERLHKMNLAYKI
jgi:predicted DNA-binding transcriptional regulator YafY